MNIIKIESCGGIFVNRHEITIKSPTTLDHKGDRIFQSLDNLVIVILTEDDFNNKNLSKKLRGYMIEVVMFPKSVFDFVKTDLYQEIAPCFLVNTKIMYY